MSIRLSFVFMLGIILALFSCQMGQPDAPIEHITVSPIHSNKIGPSDILTLKGFVKLQGTDNQPLRSITKVLFAGNSIIVLDAETDFQDIFRFETSTGKFINKIGKQTELDGGYSELYDIDLNREKNQVIGFSTQNTSFVTYNFEGDLIKQSRNGSLGEHFAIFPDGGSVIYNELSATKISGYNYLVFYDPSGNVVKRAHPYPDSIDNYGYQFSGFLCKTGHDIVFSPPLCDTVFAVRQNKTVPLYYFDFLAKSLPLATRQQIGGSGGISSAYSFLTEGIVQSKDLVLFHFYDTYGPSLGVYDVVKKQFWDASGFKRNDPLYGLIQKGELFTRENEEFVLVLKPAIIQSMIKDGLVDPPELAKTYPDLAKSFAENESNPAYILLYLEAK